MKIDNEGELKKLEMKPYLAAVLGLFLSTASLAQDAVSETKSFRADPINHPSFPMFVTSLLAGVVVLLIIAVIYNLAAVTRLFKAELSQVRPNKESLKRETIQKTKSFRKWQVYAGIGLLILLTTVTLSWKMLASTPPQLSLASSETTAEPEQTVFDAGQTDVSGEGPIEKGRHIFQNNCAPCHRNDGGGTIGPNLTDEFWIHGGEPEKISSIIESGIPNTTMPSWANTLTGENIKDVTAYIISLQGTNPPEPKAPQGEKFVRTATK